MRLLVTGARGGLGRYLHECFESDGLTRATPVDRFSEIGQPYDAIVHCAFNPRREIPAGEMHAYLEDTIFLTRALTRIPHRKFVLMSSIDVYPWGNTLQDEDAPLSASEDQTPYAFCKLAAESIVRAECPNWTILRAGLLLGRYMRSNNLMRLVRADPAPLSVTADSRFYCVLYEDIAAFLRRALADGLTGIFNAVRNPPVTMADLAERFCRRPSYGGFAYRPPPVSNARIVRACPEFGGSSLAAVDAFLREAG